MRPLGKSRILKFQLYAESLNLAQSGLMKMNFGRFHIDRENLGVGISLFVLGLVYW